MVMTEAQEKKPERSSTFQASASITSANTPLAEESHLGNFKVKFGDYMCSAQKETKASSRMDKANTSGAGRKLFSWRRQEKVNLFE